jgi:exodeoxyribonuclease VII small subunit
MGTTNEQNAINKLNFEDSLKALGEIVNKIEAGQTPLKTSIEQYERGMALIKHCRGILRSAEKRIEKISAAGEEGKDVAELEEEDEGGELF